MSVLTVICPRCNSKLKVPENKWADSVGKKATCRNCRESFVLSTEVLELELADQTEVTAPENPERLIEGTSSPNSIENDKDTNAIFAGEFIPSLIAAILAYFFVFPLFGIGQTWVWSGIWVSAVFFLAYGSEVFGKSKDLVDGLLLFGIPICAVLTLGGWMFGAMFGGGERNRAQEFRIRAAEQALYEAEVQRAHEIMGTGEYKPRVEKIRISEY